MAAFATESNAQISKIADRIKQARSVQVEDPLLEEMEGKKSSSNSSASTATAATNASTNATSANNTQTKRYRPKQKYKRYDKSSDLEWCRAVMKEAVEPYKNRNDFGFVPKWNKVDATYYMPDDILAQRGLYEYYLDNPTSIDAFKDALLPAYLNLELQYFKLGNEAELVKKGIEPEEGFNPIFYTTRFLAEDVIETACFSLSHDDLLGLWRGMINEIDEGIASGDLHETIYKCSLQKYLYNKVIKRYVNKQFDVEAKNGKLDGAYYKLALEYGDYSKINQLRLESAIANNPPQKFRTGVAAPAVNAKAVALMKQKYGAQFVKIAWITNQWQQLKQNGVFSTRKMEFDVLIKVGNEYQSYQSALWEDYAPIPGRWTGSYHISEPARNPYKVIYP